MIHLHKTTENANYCKLTERRSKVELGGEAGKCRGRSFQKGRRKLWGDGCLDCDDGFTSANISQKL